MLKKTLSLLLVLLSVMSLTLTASAAETEINPTGADTKIYFEVPEDWGDNYKYVYCYIWDIESGETLVNYMSKKGKCTLEKDGRYSFDTSKLSGLDSSKTYGIIFVLDIQIQTYDAIFTVDCIGDTLYCNNTLYENPTDSNKTARAAFYRNQDPAKYGPVMQITSIGNLIGTCLPPGATAESMFTKFLAEKLDNARTYSGKTDQDIIDDMAQGLGLPQDKIESLIKTSGLEVKWEKAKSDAPVVEKPIAPSNNGAVSSGQDITPAALGIGLITLALTLMIIIRKRKSMCA